VVACGTYGLNQKYVLNKCCKIIFPKWLRVGTNYSKFRLRYVFGYFYQQENQQKQDMYRVQTPEAKKLKSHQVPRRFNIIPVGIENHET
jgi:hypothetical protein